MLFLLITQLFSYIVSKNSMFYKLFTMNVNDYKIWVYKPTILNKQSASPIVINNGLLEVFTKTYVEIIPIIWCPVVLYYAHLAYFQLTLLTLLYYFSIGILSWTLFEYLIHRYVFHMDKFMPNKFIFILLHFIAHGIHHIIPNDKNRLVMPPILSFLILYILTPLFNTLPLIDGDLYAFKSGFITGYIIYDLTHYYLHHSSPNPASFIGKLKAHHMIHHYGINHHKRFGLTTPIWDYIFNTY